MIEACADVDDDIMSKFLDGKGDEVPEQQIVAALRKGCCSFKFFPVICGSAFKNKGVQLMLDAVVNYLPSPLDIPPVKGINPDNDKEEERKADDKEPFAGYAFKIINDPHGNLTFFRVYSGTISSGTMVSNSTRGKRERIGRILRMHANKREELTEADAGNIYAAVGLKDTRTGDTLCDEKKPILLEKMIFPEPVISIAIEPKTKADVEKLGIGLQKLAAEDPSFRIHTDEESGQTIISGMGELHLDIICDRLKREFKVESNVGKPEVAYREAITKQVKCEYKYAKQSGGRGQYGHVLMEITPGERSTGYVFENDIVGGVIPKEFIPAIEKGVKEAMERGVLAGYPLVDMHCRLYDGSYHDVDSSAQAFEIAASLCFQEGAKKAGMHPPRADHEERSRRPRAVHGRRHRRPQLAPRAHPRHDPARQRAGRRQRGPARHDVRLRHRPAFAHAGPRDELAPLFTLRAGPRCRSGRDRREGQGNFQVRE